jgi:hypothetical protein
MFVANVKPSIATRVLCVCLLVRTHTNYVNDERFNFGRTTDTTAKIHDFDPITTFLLLSSEDCLISFDKTTLRD